MFGMRTKRNGIKRKTIAAFQERNVIETQSLFKKRRKFGLFRVALTCLRVYFLKLLIILCFRPLCVVQNNWNGSETRA